MSKALAANIPAITTGGIYPGVSNGANTLSLIDIIHSIHVPVYRQELGITNVVYKSNIKFYDQK